MKRYIITILLLLLLFTPAYSSCGGRAMGYNTFFYSKAPNVEPCNTSSIWYEGKVWEIYVKSPSVTAWYYGNATVVTTVQYKGDTLLIINSINKVGVTVIPFTSIITMEEVTE